MAEGVVDLLEPVEIDEMDGEAPPLRQARQDGAVQLLDQARAVGEAGQRIVMGEVANAPVGDLLFLGAAVPGDRRQAEGECGQKAEEAAGDEQRAVEEGLSGGLVDEGADDRDRLPVDQDRHIGLGEERRAVGGVFADIDHRLARADRPHGIGVEVGDVDGRHRPLGDELRIAEGVVDDVAEDRAGLPRPVEERHALARRRFAVGDLFDVGNVLGEELRPAARRRGGMLVEEIVGGRLDGEPGAADDDRERDEDERDGASQRGVGDEFHQKTHGLSFV